MLAEPPLGLFDERNLGEIRAWSSRVSARRVPQPGPRRPEARARRLARRIEALGYRGSLEPLVAAWADLIAGRRSTRGPCPTPRRARVTGIFVPRPLSILPKLSDDVLQWHLALFGGLDGSIWVNRPRGEDDWAVRARRVIRTLPVRKEHQIHLIGARSGLELMILQVQSVVEPMSVAAWPRAHQPRKGGDDC